MHRSRNAEQRAIRRAFAKAGKHAGAADDLQWWLNLGPEERARRIREATPQRKTK